MKILAYEMILIIELLAVTLFSLYSVASFSMWSPFLFTLKCPQWLQIILQFLFIGLPQATIIIVPQYSFALYLAFGLFGLSGSLVSYLQYKRLLRKMNFNCNFDNVTLLSNNFNNMNKSNSKELTILNYFKIKSENSSYRSNTISSYQTCIMVMTITAISAVDFKIFPSRFRKSKSYGLSLMDIGVSLIITSSGLVMSKYFHGPSKLNFKKLLKSSGPLFILGIIKAIISEKFNIGANEYGKHWNFFLNLAIFPFTLLFVNILPTIHFVPVICIFWMSGYQYVLTCLNFEEYILNPPNKEYLFLIKENIIGISSLGGYCCLFLMSCYIGKFYQTLKINKQRKLIGLLSGTCLLWILFILSYIHFAPSRPLANITYVLWGLANGILHLFLIYGYECIYPEMYRFLVFSEMISKNRLLIFIIANLISSMIVRKFSQIESDSIIYLLKINYSFLALTCFIVYAYEYLYLIPKNQKTKFKFQT